MGTINNSISVNGAVSKIGFSMTENRACKGNKFTSEFLRIGAAEQEIDLSALVVSGQVVLGNTSALASVQVGFATGVYPVEIKPRGVALIPLAEATVTLYVKSSIADREIGEFTAFAENESLSFGGAHLLSAGRIVRFATTDTLPAGLSEDTDYYVVSSTPTIITVSAYPNGTAIEMGDVGTGTHTCTEVYPCYTTVLANQA